MKKFNRLTRPAIRKLKPGEMLREHGIEVERLKDGDARYTVGIMVDGIRIHRTVGRESAGVTRFQAEQLIEKLRTDARHDRLDLPKGRKRHLTFAKMASDYLEEGGRNLNAKRRHLETRLKPFFGSKRADKISDFDIKRYKRARLDEGAKRSTINRELATLTHLYSTALDAKWLKTRPKVKLFPERKGRIIALTDDQIEALLAGCLKTGHPDVWLFTVIGLNTAMRHSEILAMRFSQADFERMRLHIPEAKTGERTQPITRKLADILKRERDMRESDWVFPSSQGDGHRGRIEAPFRQAVIAAGLDPVTITPHVLRHTAITKLVQAGVDVPTIMEISGHKTSAMVLRYTHVHGRHIDEAISAIETGMEGEKLSVSRTQLHTDYTRSPHLSLGADGRYGQKVAFHQGISASSQNSGWAGFPVIANPRQPPTRILGRCVTH